MSRENVSVDVITERILARAPRPLSTYEIARSAGISWSTANAHCYKLKSIGRIVCEEHRAEVGAGKKMLWSLKT